VNRAVGALALAAALASVPVRAAGPATSGAAPTATPAVEDDVARAFAVARKRKALLLVDVWAPW
jgi:hypothetical protein